MGRVQLLPWMDPTPDFSTPLTMYMGGIAPMGLVKDLGKAREATALIALTVPINMGNVAEICDRDDRVNRDRPDRDVRQKTWAIDGKSAVESWSRSTTIRTYKRSLSLPALKALLLKLRRTDTDFQRTMKDVHFERRHDAIDENLLSMHKDLGMPIKLSASPHFYYQAAMWPCNNAINALANTELWKKIVGVLCGVNNSTLRPLTTTLPVVKLLTYEIPNGVRQLGHTNSKVLVLEDYKIACLYLELQKKQTQYYEARRQNFYFVAIVNDRKKVKLILFLIRTPTYQLKEPTKIMDKAQHTTPSMHRQHSFVSLMPRIRLISPTSEMRLSASLNTKLRWNIHNVRHTPDIINLYYFNDDGAALQEVLLVGRRLVAPKEYC
jgi:hypothetical protein